MRTNVPQTYRATTHEGGIADAHQSPATELERAVASCLLFEDTFYESGSALAQRIAQLCAAVPAETLAALAVKARTDYRLRHVPLWLCRQMVRLHKGRLVGDTLAAVIQRPDELAEFLALYWKDKRQPLSKQAKRGLALAFQKFSPYQFAKWDREGAVKLRDVLFLCHAKPKDAEQDALWKGLIAGTLESADTWEVALSRGDDKKATWERMLAEGTLPYMALLMNLRNIAVAGVETEPVLAAIRAGAPRSKALPFRFFSAAQAAPQYASALSDAMVSAVTERLHGRTAVLIDVSGSMDAALSAKGQRNRLDAAGCLAVLVREMCPDARVFTFSHKLVEVPNYRGLPLVDGIKASQPHGGTMLGAALQGLLPHLAGYARLIVVTDEQAHDGLVPPAGIGRGYLINVGPYKPGLDTAGGWTRINGWSDRLMDWIRADEAPQG